jgi:hypothetical protein
LRLSVDRWAVKVTLGVAARVEASHKVRYRTAAELVETLGRALTDNSVVRSSTPCSAMT